MSHELYFDRKVGVVFVRYGKELDKDIIIDASKAVNAIPDLPKGSPVVVDFRQCENINLSSDDTREIAQFMAQFNETRGEFKIAQLVSGKLMFGTSRMSAATIDQNMIEIRVFDQEQQAFDWIGLPEGFRMPF